MFPLPPLSPEAIESPVLDEEDKEEEKVVPVGVVAAAHPANAQPLPEEVFCSGPEKRETTFVYMTTLTLGSMSGIQQPAASSSMNSAEGEEDGDVCGEERNDPKAGSDV